MSLEIRWILLEQDLQDLEALVGVTLTERDRGKPPPRGEKIGSLLGDLRQDPFGFIRFSGKQVEIGKAHPRERAGRRDRRRRLELALGLGGIPPGEIEVTQHYMRVDRLGLP